MSGGRLWVISFRFMMSIFCASFVGFCCLVFRLRKGIKSAFRGEANARLARSAAPVYGGSLALLPRGALWRVRLAQDPAGKRLVQAHPGREKAALAERGTDGGQKIRGEPGLYDRSQARRRCSRRLAKSGSSWTVRKTIRVRGCERPISHAASRPLMPGMLMSSTTRSGTSRSISFEQRPRITDHPDDRAFRRERAHHQGGQGRMIVRRAPPARSARAGGFGLGQRVMRNLLRTREVAGAGNSDSHGEGATRRGLRLRLRLRRGGALFMKRWG